MSDPIQFQPRKIGRWDVRKEAVAFLRQKLTDALYEIGMIGLVNVNDENVLHLPFCEEDNIISGMINERKRLVISARCPDGNDIALVSMLEAGSLTFLNSVLESNQKIRNQATEWMKNILQELTNKYRDELQRFLRINGTSVIEESVFSNFHKVTTEQLLEKYDEEKKPGNDPFQHSHRKRLENSFQEIFSTAVDTQLKTVGELQQVVEEFIEEQNAEHLTFLREQAKKTDLGVKLAAIHKQSKRAASKKLRDTFITIGTTELRFAEIQLHESLSFTYNDVLEEVAEEKKVLMTKYKKCINLYKSEMEKLLNEKKISLEENDLIMDHDLIQKSCLASFQDGYKQDADWQPFRDLKQKLESKIHDMFYIFVEKWEVKRTTGILEVKNFLLEIRMELAETLRNVIGSADTLEVLMAENEAFISSAKTNFCTKFEKLHPDYQNSCLNDLTTFSEITLEKAKTVFLEKVANVVNTELSLLVSNFQEEYIKTMRRNVTESPFSDMPKLLEMHEVAKTKICVDFLTVPKKTEDKEIIKKHEEQLLIKLQNSFSIFAEEQKGIKNNNILIEAKQTAKIMTHAHFVNMKEKVYEGCFTDKQLEEVHENECIRISNDLAVITGALMDSPMVERINIYLSENLSQVYSNLQKNLVIKIDAVNKQVQTVYNEKLKKTNALATKELIPTELSPNFHAHSCETAIQKAVQQKLIPTTSRLLLEAKLFLNAMYKKRIVENAVIGIDFGTGCIRGAVYVDGKIQRVPHSDESGKFYNALACYVGLEDFEGSVGQTAAKIVQSSSDWCPVFYDMKTLIIASGSKKKEVSVKDVSFKVTFENNEYSICGESNKYPIKTIVSNLFRKVQENAEKFLCASVNKCVIVNMSEERVWQSKFQIFNQVVNEAAKLAGFKQITQFYDTHIIAKHAIQYSISLTPKEILFVIDFGISHFKYYVVKEYKAAFNQRVYDEGGCVLQRNMMDYCIKEFSNKESVSLEELQSDTANAKHRRRRVFDACGKALPFFSKANIFEVQISVSNCFSGKNLAVKITPQRFEELNAKKFNDISQTIDTLLRIRNLTKDSIDKVLLIGGFSHLIKIRGIVKSYFGDKIVNLPDVEPEEVLAYLAAVEGARLAAKEIRKNL